MEQANRSPILTTFAILFAVLAISNFSKPLVMSPQAGFVLLGTRLHGVPNMIFGPLFGAYLMIYAYGIWRMKKWAAPMAYAYAAYVVLNLIIYSSRSGWGESGGPLGAIAYVAGAVGVSSGAAYILYKRRAELT
ncbi:MAG: hypothetical protein ACREQF_11345 [Candidatus Binataceae bacterium]